MEVFRIKKATERLRMIERELATKSRDYSLMLGIYNMAWWLGWYISPLKSLNKWGDRRIRRWIYDYIDKNYSEILDTQCSVVPTPCQSDPKIWVFWLQGYDSMPELVKGCYRQLTSINDNVVLITKDNISDYCEYGDRLVEKLDRGDIIPAHISDILRQYLLSRHGGLWVDATCFMPAKVPEMHYKMLFISPHSTIKESQWVSWCLGTNVIGNPLFTFTCEVLYQTAMKKRSWPHYLYQDYVMTYAYHNIPAVKDMIDDCPANSVGRNDLHFLLNMPYNQEKYEALSKQNWIFKLSYKTPWRTVTDGGKTTFYGHLIAR